MCFSNIVLFFHVFYGLAISIILERYSLISVGETEVQIENENKLRRQKKDIKELIPALISKQKSEAEQYAAVYESINGIKTLYDEILEFLHKNKQDFIGFTLGEEYKNKQANIFFKNYDAKRKQLRIKTKLIGLEHQRKFLSKEYGKNPNVKIKYLSHSVPTGLIIYGNKVAIIIWSETPVGMVVENKEVAKSFKQYFEILWKISKK